MKALQKSVKRKMKALQKSVKRKMRALQKSVKKEDMKALQKSVKRKMKALQSLPGIAHAGNLAPLSCTLIKHLSSSYRASTAVSTRHEDLLSGCNHPVTVSGVDHWGNCFPDISVYVQSGIVGFLVGCGVSTGVEYGYSIAIISSQIE